LKELRNDIDKEKVKQYQNIFLGAYELNSQMTEENITKRKIIIRDRMRAL